MSRTPQPLHIFRKDILHLWPEALVVVALLIFGGETLHGFSAALVIGIIAGTYSSIYISAALALDFGLRNDDLLERKLTKPEEVDGLP